MVFLLLLFIPAGLVASFAFVGYGFGTLGRVGIRRADREVRLRSLAALLGAAAAALYTWGLLHVAGAVLEAEDGGTGSSPLRPCRTPGGEERTLSVVDYTVDYMPSGSSARPMAAEATPPNPFPATSTQPCWASR
ncbi:hypothetical protein [Streptomyces sp. XD-27]|uniref:hypothetical protein n=1 Tax=Streptomyces sp. XD-27 TaxID=3062779 RepID=UPI0026F451D6|nr:hypothetical protein [Streptomyces sp. XD-27]WKX69382.1 hypothetical protein Q3Y56_05140 [Streptomyces sp. XD-27]